MASIHCLLCVATALTAASAKPIFGGSIAKHAFAGWLSIWRDAYQDNDGSVPNLDDKSVPKDLQGIKSKIVISSGGAAGGVVTEGMGYAIMVEGMQAAAGNTDGLANGLALTKGWLGMVYGPKETSMGKAEHPLGGGDNSKGSATEVATPPYGVSAIEGKSGGYSGMAAWKFPVNQCAPFCHGTATDGDEDAALGMIYLAEALKYPADFTDMVIRAIITFASTDLGFPSLYRTLPDGTRLFVPKGGSDWGGLLPESGTFKSSQEPWCYNPSYFAPGHYRAFRDFASKHWKTSFNNYLPKHLDGKDSTLKELIAAFDGAVIAGYNILFHASCSSGAVANWVGVKAECKSDDVLGCEGVPWATTPYVGKKGTCTASGTTFGSYGPDASRTPWRIAMDYILYEQESATVTMYDRKGTVDHALHFNAGVYLNRFVHQYKKYANCDGGKKGGCNQQGKVATFELASAFSMNAPGLTCVNVPNAGQDWWAGFMSYPTFTVFVAPFKGMSANESAQWMDTLASICDFSGKKPTGGLCSSSYFELGQEVISTMVMSGAVFPLSGGKTKGFSVDKLPTTTKSLTTEPPKETTTPELFDCDASHSNWKKAWSEHKKKWCCQRYGRGCPEHRSAPFDCKEGFKNWVHGWSVDKKEWCCQHAQRGCEEEKSEQHHGDGFCCLVASHNKDSCEDCVLRAKKTDTHCASSRSACMGCAPHAKWCAVTDTSENETFAQVRIAKDEDDNDSNAASTGKAANDFDPSSDLTRNGNQIPDYYTPQPTSAPTQAPTAAPTHSLAPTAAPTAEPTSVPTEDTSFCCLAAGDADNHCDTCYPAGKAVKGSLCGSSEKDCLSCGGHSKWCPGQAEVLLKLEADDVPGHVEEGDEATLSDGKHKYKVQVVDLEEAYEVKSISQKFGEAVAVLTPGGAALGNLRHFPWMAIGCVAAATLGVATTVVVALRRRSRGRQFQRLLEPVQDEAQRDEASPTEPQCLSPARVI